MENSDTINRLFEPKTAHEKTRKKGFIEIKLDRASFANNQAPFKARQNQLRKSPHQGPKDRTSFANTGIKGLNLLEYYEARRKVHLLPSPHAGKGTSGEYESLAAVKPDRKKSINSIGSQASIDSAKKKQ